MPGVGFCGLARLKRFSKRTKGAWKLTSFRAMKGFYEAIAGAFFCINYRKACDNYTMIWCITSVEVHFTTRILFVAMTRTQHS